MTNVLGDVRIAVRSLLRSRGFTFVSVLTLAVAIGANTAIFSVVDAVLLRPLPFADPDELVIVRLDASGAGAPELPFSDRGYWHFAEKNRSFEQFGGYTQTRWPLTGEGDPVQVAVGILTLSTFEALGVAPARGRFPSAEEDAPGGPPVTLLGHGLWVDRFASDPDVLGRTIDLNGQSIEVIGVMPPEFAFPTPDIDLWVPYRLDPASENFGGHGIGVVARLREGATVEAATSDAEALIQRFGEAGYGPEWLTNVFTGRAVIRPLTEQVVGDARQPLLIVFATVVFVLLIACSNVANLLLVRAESRVRDTAVRVAMGAGRARLVQAVLIESLLVSLAGGLLGVLLAWIGVRALVGIGPAAIPRLGEIGISGNVLLFTSAVSIGAALLFGLLPALRVGTRRSLAMLKDGGRGSTVGRDRHRTRSILVVAQTALALILLVGSGLMLRSFQRLRAVEPGFREAGILTFGVSLPPSRYPDPEATARFYDELLAGLSALPGVESVAGANALPLSGGGPILATEIEEFPTAEGDFPPVFPVRRVTPGYFEAMGIPLVEGRTFEGRDHQERLGTAVVGSALKERYWPAGSAVGKRLAPSTPAMVEIVGVVGDVHDAALDAPADAVVYLPMLDSVGGGVRGMSIVVRTRGEPLAVMPAVRQQVAALDPALPLTDVRTIEELVGDSMSRTTFTMTLLALAALVALFLGSVGIYGVISYVVTQRTGEMGVRQALGADAGAVRWLVLRQGMGLAGLGVLIGVLLAVYLGRFLATLLYGVGAFDVLSFLGGAGVFLVVALLASFLPARRASRIPPAEALRQP